MSKTTYTKNEQATPSVAYDDTNLRNRVTALEAKRDNDNQNLSINNRTISISGGNSITLPEDRDTIYNDTDIKRRLTALEGKTDNFVTGVTASRTGNKVKLTYNFVTGQPKSVEFDDKDTISVAYDDTALRNRVQALEGKVDNDNQTLSITNNRLTISNGNSVDIPQPDLSNYVTADEYNDLKNALAKILEDLKGSGAWEQTGNNIFVGNLKPNRHFATGNINLFGGQPDGDDFIRTNNSSTENDLAGGIS